MSILFLNFMMAAFFSKVNFFFLAYSEVVGIKFFHLLEDREVVNLGPLLQNLPHFSFFEVGVEKIKNRRLHHQIAMLLQKVEKRVQLFLPLFDEKGALVPHHSLLVHWENHVERQAFSQSVSQLQTVRVSSLNHVFLISDFELDFVAHVTVEEAPFHPCFHDIDVGNLRLLFL